MDVPKSTSTLQTTQPHQFQEEQHSAILSQQQQLQRQFIETQVVHSGNNRSTVIMNADGILQMPDGRNFHFYYFGFDEETNTQSIVFHEDQSVWPPIHCPNEDQSDCCLRYPDHSLGNRDLVETGAMERRWANFIVYHKLMHYFLKAAYQRKYDYLLDNFQQVCEPQLLSVPGFKLLNQLQRELVLSEIKTILKARKKNQNRYTNGRNKTDKSMTSGIGTDDQNKSVGGKTAKEEGGHEQQEGEHKNEESVNDDWIERVSADQ